MCFELLWQIRPLLWLNLGGAILGSRAADSGGNSGSVVLLAASPFTGLLTGYANSPPGYYLSLVGWQVNL